MADFDVSRSPVQKYVNIVHNSIEACKDKEAVVVATEWKEFLEIDWQEVYNHMSKPAFVFDGRLLVDAEKLKKIGFKVRVTPFLYPRPHADTDNAF